MIRSLILAMGMVVAGQAAALPSDLMWPAEHLAPAEMAKLARF